MQLPMLLCASICCLKMIVFEALGDAWSTRLLLMRLLRPLIFKMLAVCLHAIMSFLPAIGCKGQMTVPDLLGARGSPRLVLVGGSPVGACFGHLVEVPGLFWAV